MNPYKPPLSFPRDPDEEKEKSFKIIPWVFSLIVEMTVTFCITIIAGIFISIILAYLYVQLFF